MIPFYGINILKGKTRMIKSDFGLISDHFHAVTTFWLPRSFSVYTLTLHSMLHSLNPIHHHSMHICMRLKYNKNIVYYLVQHTDVLTSDEDSPDNSWQTPTRLKCSHLSCFWAVYWLPVTAVNLFSCTMISNFLSLWVSKPRWLKECLHCSRMSAGSLTFLQVSVSRSIDH